MFGWGRLSGVFGLRTNAFDDAPKFDFDLDGRSIATRAHRFEVLEPSTATVLARFTNTVDRSPAITANRFGKGNALYLATPSDSSAIDPILHRVLQIADIQTGPSTPVGVYARVVHALTLHVNTTAEMKKIEIKSPKRDRLTNRLYDR